MFPGFLDDMLNHVKNHKHQRNFLKLIYPEDPRIDSLNKNELIEKAGVYIFLCGGGNYKWVRKNYEKSRKGI